MHELWCITFCIRSRKSLLKKLLTNAGLQCCLNRWNGYEITDKALFWYEKLKNREKEEEEGNEQLAEFFTIAFYFFLFKKRKLNKN